MYSAVVNRRTQETVATRVYWAHNWLDRLKGLLGTSSLEAQAGIWLMPCRSIHMLGMRYAIDAIFLDAQQQICQLSPAIRPYRICTAPRPAYSVLELQHGRIQALDLNLGDTLAFVSTVDC